jgi:hypothetical protein
LKINRIASLPLAMTPARIVLARGCNAKQSTRHSKIHTKDKQPYLI